MPRRQDNSFGGCVTLVNSGWCCMRSEYEERLNCFFLFRLVRPYLQLLFF
ncbi:hypothetical protein HanRHA438_Chr06g0256801 [Helianthus annuus]|nr:hypothetical protein HanRHA438_Chr06g0256801 [Helianthus annuus]